MNKLCTPKKVTEYNVLMHLKHGKSYCSMFMDIIYAEYNKCKTNKLYDKIK